MQPVTAKVNLIECTPNAEQVLVYTKNTRLNMDMGRWHEVKLLSDFDLGAALEYMSNTIPSSWEFVDYIFAIENVSRGFTHQFVRTRTNSYAQQSMRVTDMSGFNYIQGPSITGALIEDIYSDAMAAANGYYQQLIEQGVPEEDARGVLPTNIATNIIAKINLRTLSDMARSRTGGRTQNEYQEVMQQMIDEVLEVHPWASMFLFPKGRDFFDEVEQYARDKNDRDLLKIIDKMRKAL